MTIRKHLTFLILVFGLTGCVSLLDATSEGPIEEYSGTRTLGTVVEDENIETKISVNLRKASETLSNSNIDVVSFNGVVLLVGEVPDQQSKSLAEQVASKTRSVRKVYNELNIAGVSTWISRYNDAWITTKVSTQMTFSENFPSSRVKVITEQGVVYLMGLVSKNEGDYAVEITKNVYGVEKIVKLFEYI
ncbi:BON domain-containing protein [Litoribrevibacter albus]|uniref:Phospholipid-binding protein n=1 Tax=Litoribrevibacter albus TaxID=1473156 RepID=A0AA37SDM2_9GAMM|nr:BON domain-containing protein [Litoribrevibacter albus]GLQ33241.1 phospholipid-binding protein [Litoribrevibacter albus]